MRAGVWRTWEGRQCGHVQGQLRFTDHVPSTMNPKSGWETSVGPETLRDIWLGLKNAEDGSPQRASIP